MSSSMLRILAAFLAIGAIAVGYMGYQAGKQPKPEVVAPAKTESEGQPVILAARRIAAGRAITAEDLTLGHVPIRPVRAYKSDRELLGKKPKTTIATGEMLLETHFPRHSELARTLAAGERAVAIKIDEVIGTGGFIEPEDRVDVLLFLHSDRQEIGENSSAQVILANARVLAFGNMLEPPVEISPENPAQTGLLDKARQTANKSKDDEKPTGKNSKTAVLAVPAEEATTLMLAESSGKIRLALHGVERKEDSMLSLAGIPAAAAGLKATTPSLAKEQPEKRKYYVELRDLLAKGATTRTHGRPAAPAQAIVHRGSSVETVAVNPSESPETQRYFGSTFR
ncbi:MAG: Flp pilus assembly protein CpaB [Gammaproteobacteria bacterium]